MTANDLRVWAHILLMEPKVVKPYVMPQKTAANDAEVTSEAATRPNMRFVPLNTVEDQDLQCLRRVRGRLEANSK